MNNTNAMIKPFSLNDKWFLMTIMIMAITCFSLQATIGQKGNLEKMLVSESGKWHPETIYIMKPDMKLTFKFPYETDQSGVMNLLFQSKESGVIYQLDTIKGKYRYYNTRLTSGKYDAILLYNNGKYLRYNNVVFEKNTSIEVNMEKLSVQPCDLESQKWLNLRAFDTAIGTRSASIKKVVKDSGINIKGYVFDDYSDIALGSINIEIDGTKIFTSTNYDGYFEVEMDKNQTLVFSFVGCIDQKIHITGNSGLIVLMEDKPYDRDAEPIISTGK